MPDELFPGIQIEDQPVDPLVDRIPERLLRVRDARGFPEAPIARFARLLPAALDVGEWSLPVRQRVRQLMDVELPYVLTPTEAGLMPDGSFYYLEESWSCSLEEKIPATQGMANRQEAVTYLEQILTGLAALHDRELAHGDIRPANIMLRPVDPHRKTFAAWLVNTAWGGLTFWSQGEYLSPEAKRYFPPEWNGLAGSPTPQADLYALGVLAHQLTHGRESLPVRKQGWGWFQWGWDTLSQWLTAHEPEGLSRMLVRDKEDRPANAREALKRFRRWCHWIAWRKFCLGMLGLVLILATVLSVAVLVFWRQSSNNHDAYRLLTAKVSRLQEESEKLAQENKELRYQTSSLLAEKNVLQTELATSRPSLLSAQKIWNDNRQTLINHKDELDSDTFSNVMRTIRSAADRSTFQKWGQDVVQAQKLMPRWRNRDPELETHYRRLLDTPWEGAAFNERLSHLEEAAKVWKSLAETTSLSYDKLETRIGRERAEIQQILYGWLKQIEERKQWGISWKKGTAPAGHGTNRTLWVYGDEWSNADPHAWSSPTKHDYTQPAHRLVTTFQWTAGKPIEVKLKADWHVYTGGYRPDRIYQQFSGPLAIWQAHAQGGVSQDGFSLEFEVVDCPGPPRPVSLPSSFEGLLK